MGLACSVLPLAACCCCSWAPGQHIGHKMFLFGFFGSDERWRAERSSLHFPLAVREKREESDVNLKIAYSLPKHGPGDTATRDQAAVVLRVCAVAGHTGRTVQGADSCEARSLMISDETAVSLYADDALIRAKECTQVEFASYLLHLGYLISSRPEQTFPHFLLWLPSNKVFVTGFCDFTFF